MPLTLTEYTSLVQMLNRMMAGQPQQEVVFHDRPPPDSGPLVASALDRFSVSIDRLTTLLSPLGQIAEQALKQQGDAQTGPQEPAAPKRTRKAAEKTNGQGTPASAPDPLAAAPTTVETQPASPPSVSPVPPPATTPAAGAEEMPDFLNRAKQGAGVSVSPVPPATQAAPGSLTEDQVKAVLRQYMNKFGADGPNKLTALLQLYGTNQFSSLPKEQWPAIVAKANQEMLL
jgi:hypothetical protein